MSKKFINKSFLSGYVYEHDLEVKVSGPKSKNPGIQFIAGTLSIATDRDLMNVVQVHFTYVVPTTSKGKPNATYTTLNAIIDGKIGNVMDHGIENAGCVRVDSAIGLNEWFDKRNNNELVSIKRNEGGFVHQISENELNPKLRERATFDVDILINNVRKIDADEERGTPESVKVRGAIFDFRKSLLPVEFSVASAGFDDERQFQAAMNYFESLDASPKSPVLTNIRGTQISQTIVRKIEEESAFGDSAIRETRSSYKDFAITWAKPGEYEWDTEETILASELSEMMAAREVYLADMKRRREEWEASQGNALSNSAAVSDGGYDF